MIDTLIGVALGYLGCQLLAGAHSLAEFFHVSLPVSYKGPIVGPGGKRVRAPTGPDLGPVPSNLPPMVLTSTAAPFPTQTPDGLPPFPSGWRPTRATPSVVERAWALLPMLKDGQRKVELGPAGTWLSYYRSKNRSTGKTGVTVYEPKAQPARALA